jgi:hypothetical protein
MTVHLDPHAGTPAYHQAIHRIHAAANKVFRRQKDRALEEAKRLLKSKKSRIFKETAAGDADDFDPTEIAGFIIEEVNEEFKELPGEIRPALEQVILSGINNGILQLEIHDVSMIASANNIAADYARERAAELVGMKYDVEGNLVDNPNAEWAISDTTRDKLRRIITAAFEEETDIKVVAAKIQTALQDDEAGIFTDARAEMIAQTEVANAQAEGNFGVWKKSGLVETVRWTVSADEPCDECEGNADEVVEFGKEFQSGDIMPPAHPRCRCVLVAVKIKEE